MQTDKAIEVVKEGVMKKLSKKQLCSHIKKNISNEYSAAVEISALYIKLYRELPKGIGLSGQQAEFAKSFAEELPELVKEG